MTQTASASGVHAFRLRRVRLAAVPPFAAVMGAVAEGAISAVRWAACLGS
ncbi:hypothetical protein [Streptomyces mirabilis]